MTELELSERLGVGRLTLRDTRSKKLRRGEDWQLENGRVAYTTAGETKLLAALGLDGRLAEGKEQGEGNGQEGGVDALQGQPAEADAGGEPAEAEHGRTGTDTDGQGRTRTDTDGQGRIGTGTETVRVVKLCMNSKIVLARRANKEVVRVRVRDGGKFRVGMEAPVRRVQGDLWELTRRGPRWAGRW